MEQQVLWICKEKIFSDSIRGCERRLDFGPAFILWSHMNTVMTISSELPKIKKKENKTIPAPPPKTHNVTLYIQLMISGRSFGKSIKVRTQSDFIYHLHFLSGRGNKENTNNKG